MESVVEYCPGNGGWLVRHMPAQPDCGLLEHTESLGQLLLGLAAEGVGWGVGGRNDDYKGGAGTRDPWSPVLGAVVLTKLCSCEGLVCPLMAYLKVQTAFQTVISHMLEK